MYNVYINGIYIKHFSLGKYSIREDREQCYFVVSGCNMYLRCSVWACGSLINPQSSCLYLLHAVWKKYLERHSIIYASRYLHTAIAYKLQNVFQYSVSLQYNCFDTVFTTMYFNTAQLCLWPMTFFGLAGRICPLLVHATSGLPFIPSFTCPLLL